MNPTPSVLPIVPATPDCAAELLMLQRLWEPGGLVVRQAPKSKIALFLENLKGSRSLVGTNF
jgi:hypothetical protein